MFSHRHSLLTHWILTEPSMYYDSLANSDWIQLHLKQSLIDLLCFVENDNGTTTVIINRLELMFLFFMFPSSMTSDASLPALFLASPSIFMWVMCRFSVC